MRGEYEHTVDAKGRMIFPSRFRDELGDWRVVLHSPYGMQVPGWNSGSGNMKDEVIVAVVDGFVDYTHPDLKDVIYEFSEDEQQALGCGKYGYDATQKNNSEPPESSNTFFPLYSI